MSRRSEESESGSFLVRVWMERRERDGEDRPARFYLRNLQTGTERYLADGSKLAESLLSQARDDRQEEGETLSPAESGAG